jgi:hypothetical protein
VAWIQRFGWVSAALARVQVEPSGARSDVGLSQNNPKQRCLGALLDWTQLTRTGSEFLKAVRMRGEKRGPTEQVSCYLGGDSNRHTAVAVRSSLNGHAFGKVAGLVDIASQQHATVVSEKLERNNRQQRGHGFVRARDIDHVVD